MTTAIKVESNPVLQTTEPAAVSPTFKNAKFLVIDDTAEVRMIIIESLKIYGFATVVADDGVSGVEMARQHSPDLIICDINMPNVHAYENLTGIRNNDPTATPPFI